MKEKAYIILGRSKTTGEFLGYIEHSFSMAYSKSHVRLWRVDDQESAYAYLRNPERFLNLEKQLASFRSRYPKYDWNVFRVGSKNCPVAIDWATYHAGQKNGKSGYRNLGFRPRLFCPG